MPRPFHRIRIDPADAADPTRSITGSGPDRSSGPSPTFSTNEAAARYYLSQALRTTAPAALRGLAPSNSHQPVPDLVLQATQDLPTNTVALKFEQTAAAVPVFGTQVVVELKKDRSLVWIAGNLAEPPGTRFLPRLSQEKALGEIAKLTGAAAADLEANLRQPATLTLYHDEAGDTWNLAYFFRRVPTAPPGESAPSLGHGLAPRPGRPEYDYLVDAENGGVLFYYSSNPTVSTAALNDLLDKPRVIYVEPQPPGFALHDTLRNIKTFDLGGKDYWSPLPAAPLQAPAAPPEFPTAAVSAHANAAHVLDFYRSVLARQGVDDKAMCVISVINVTDSAHQTPPEWHNAVWYDHKMWYGQDSDGNGGLRSYARFLDVIGHELTHGVTQFTSDLVYKGQSGALDESFSDIFGVLINNWHPIGGFRKLEEFDWQIGRGVRKDGKPLRDLSDPAVTGDPAHMKDYVTTTDDSGGVHTNSNIHNKAFSNVITTKDTAGNWVFTPNDVAVMYYLCLSRLPRTADFNRVRETLLDVTKTYFAAQAATVQTARVKAVANAYTAVGID